MSRDRTPLKKALMPQKSACFQSFDGWSWHWVHWICWPRNSRVVNEVRLTAPSPRWAMVKFVEPLSLLDPCAVTSSWTVSFQGRSSAN